VRSVAERPALPWTLGIDLRSGPRYPTGLAVMDGERRLRYLGVVRTDEQIDAAVERWRPALVAIDAPLALPEGRCCARKDCECARHGIMREVDRICAAAGYRPFPALLPSMVPLTLRGIALLGRLSAAGGAVIEVYPGMAQDILGVPRKRSGVEALARGLRRCGVRGLPRGRRPTHDELDAATCALVAQLHLAGATETMGAGIPVPLVHPRSALRETPARAG
jgi:predicted nuclease with RNAse H fold